MSTFYKTELGLQTLSTRQLTLSPKQRRLLILVGSDDFNSMNAVLQQQIAPPELIQQLLDLGLIQSNSTPTNPPLTTDHSSLDLAPQKVQMTSSFDSALSTQAKICDQTKNSHVAIHSMAQQKTQDTPVPEAPRPKKAFSFNDLKKFMTQQLQQYCGLMAQLLIEKIRASTHIAELKTCQMQWITYLQESRIGPKQLNEALNHVNYSMRALAPQSP